MLSNPPPVPQSHTSFDQVTHLWPKNASALLGYPDARWPANSVSQVSHTQYLFACQKLQRSMPCNMLKNSLDLSRGFRSRHLGRRVAHVTYWLILDMLHLQHQHDWCQNSGLVKRRWSTHSVLCVVCGWGRGFLWVLCHVIQCDWKTETWTFNARLRTWLDFCDLHDQDYFNDSLTVFKIVIPSVFFGEIWLRSTPLLVFA